MTKEQDREAEVARIAATLEQLPPAPYGGYGYRALSGQNLAAALHDAGLRFEPLDGLTVSAAEVAVMRKALVIGAISHDGDGWFAKEAGYDYDDAEATLIAARRIAAHLLGDPSKEHR